MKNRVSKPWGAYEVIEKKNEYWIKKLFVKGGEQLSVHSHHDREEQWIVLEGHIRARIGNRKKELGVGQMCHINKDQKHRITGIAPMSVILEIAFGHPLEGDVTRYEDRYGRVK